MWADSCVLALVIRYQLYFPQVMVDEKAIMKAAFVPLQKDHFHLVLHVNLKVAWGCTQK